MPLKRFLLAGLVAALLSPVWVSEGAAQGLTAGSIRGRVVSDEGAAVASAQVVAVNTETGLRRGTLTDAQGRYSIPLLPPGTYRVDVQSLGFASAAVADVQVRIGETTPVDIGLRTEAVAIEGVTVTGARTQIDAARGGVAQTITPEQVESLPVSGRDFTDLINLSPLVSPQPGTGTGGQFSIGGARTSGTNVQVDGVDANNQYFGENRGSSRTPFAFSLESIKELQLVTNGFDVEYGNYTGGVVNAVTKGGTNAFRGSLFSYFRNEALTGEDFQGRAPTEYKVAQFGANASGPIMKDKLHFFASADVQRKDQPIFPGGEFTAEQIARTISLLEAKGVQNAAQYFTAEQAEDNLVLFGRVDWTISNAHRLTVRQNYSDFEQTNDRVNEDEATTHGGPFLNTAWSTVAELNSVLGANAFNTLRVQFSDEHRPRKPNPGGYIPEIEIDLGDDGIEFGGDGIIFRNDLKERKLQLVDNFTYQMGSHTFKVGTNNSLVSTTNVFWLLGNGEFRFEDVFSRGKLVKTGIDNFRDGTPTRYIRFVTECDTPLQANSAGQNVICRDPQVPMAEFENTEWSVYAQDAWRASDRLQLTAGLRYGGTLFGQDAKEIPAIEAAFGVPTGLVPDFSGISPRFAFTYDVTGREISVIRGGVGLLVGRAPTVLVGNVLTGERPVRRLECRGSAIPNFDLEELLADPTGLNNPFACAGTGRVGRPEQAIFSEGFELPRTLKANVGYEQVLFAATKVGVDLLFSRTESNYTVQDLNLNDPIFTLASEGGRPVFVSESNYFRFGRFHPFDAQFRSDEFARVYSNASEGEARSYSVALELDQKVREDLQFGVRYAYTNAYDNGSFSCCTSGEGFGGTPTAGNPNVIGDPGDETNGNWGPSDFERRHAITANFLYRAPWGIRASGIMRFQSGTPWTPVVRGDVNADGISFNDRAFVSTDLFFVGGDAAEQAQQRSTLEGIVAGEECLSQQRGQIVTRNSCRNPWFNSVDLRLAKEIPTIRGQRAEVLVDVFNILNGLNDEWGRYTAVSRDGENLLLAEGFDDESGRVIYRVNEDFGEERPVGFDPFQFQVQLGVRYRF